MSGYLVVGGTQAPITALSVKALGAKGDGTTDDHDALSTAFANAISSKQHIMFQPGTYKTSKYIDVLGARNITVWGQGAVIQYPSDDETVGTDSVANSTQKSRSALLLRYCRDVLIRDLIFAGGTSNDLSNANTGQGMYATRCVGVRVENCEARYGRALFVQDATDGTTATGTSIAVSNGVVTVTANSAPFTPGHEGGQIVLSKCADNRNAGAFLVTSYISTTQVTIANLNAVSETSAFRLALDDTDRGTKIRGCRSYWCLGEMYTGKDSVISECEFEQPPTNDLTGKGDYLSVNGTTVTLTDNVAPFTPGIDGKYIIIAGATNSANNGQYGPITYISSTQISFTNAAGVNESYPGQWWIPNGERVGLGAGAGAISVSGTTVTFTAATPSFSATDVNKALRITNPTSSGNHVSAVVTAYVSPTQIQFTNATGVSEAFSGIWTIDNYDRITNSTTNVIGSSHAIYLFGDRTNITIDSCTFRNIRMNCVKASGTNLPLRNLTVTNCTAIECSQFVDWGADGQNEHSNLIVAHNRFVDCGTQRTGWNNNNVISFLGCSGAYCCDNEFYYTRPSVFSASGLTTSGLKAIQISRYVSGASQPVESFVCERNTFYKHAGSSADQVIHVAISVNDVGERTRWATAGTLTRNSTTIAAGSNGAALPQATISVASTSGFPGSGTIQVTTSNGPQTVTYTGTTGTTFTGCSGGTGTMSTAGAVSGTTMTLSDPNASFYAPEMVGQSITFVNCTTAANNGTYTIIGVPSGTTLTFTNANGVAGALGGTYRISPTHGTGGPSIAYNQIHHVATTGIELNNNVAPEVCHNVFSGLIHSITLNGDCTPRVYSNRLVNQSNSNLGGSIWFRGNIAWPIVYDNTVTNHASGPTTGHAMDVSIDGSNPCDFPLLGVCGRTRPSHAQEEIVVAYGAKLVDGDTLTLDGVTYTYKATTPTGNQFNSMSGLMTLIAAQAGGTTYTCDDYGASFAVSVVTNHMRIRKVAQTTSDGTMTVIVSALNSTALVLLRNSADGTKCLSRGSGSTGPVPDGTVVWTPLATLFGGAQLWADNSAAQTLLQTGGFRSAKNVNDGGCCETIKHGSAAGTEEFRWSYR